MHKGTIIGLLVALAGCSGDGDKDGSGSGDRQVGSPSTAGGAGSGPNDFGNAPTSTPPATPGSGVPVVGGPGAPGGLCEVVHLTASPSTPDMLIVLDRSGSMGQEQRWVPSAEAVRSIATGLQSQIRFGLALFPDPASTGGGGTSVQIDASACINDPDIVGCITNLLADAGITVNTGTSLGSCAPGKIVVPIDLHNGPAIEAALNMTQPNGGTPTGETLQLLVDEFAAPVNDPDTLPNPKFVLLVTDGQPTCPAGAGSATTQPDIDLSNGAIDMLTARGVRTYVIGYNTTGPGNEEVDAVLDGFALRGGTGDTQHRPVEDQQSLLAEFQRIAGAAVSCTFVLDMAPARADYVLVRVDGAQVNLNQPDGWALVGDRTVELRGAACSTLQGDGDHAVDVEVRCEVVTPE